MTYRVAVAVSGRGSNLIALCDALGNDAVATVVQVIADRPAYAIERAHERGIPAQQLANFRDGAEWLRILEAARVDLLVLAGYLRLVPAEVVAAMPGRIINIHPALLPRHGGKGMHGARVHEAVVQSGDVESGATVHLVDEQYDNGGMLAQGRVMLPPGATADEVAAIVLKIEHRLLPAAVLSAARAGHPVPFEFE